MFQKGSVINWIILIAIGILVVVALILYFRYSSRNSGQLVHLTNQSTEEPEQVEDSAEKTSFNKSVFFIHHSTGEIYWEGGMGKALQEDGYQTAAPWWEGNTDPQDFFSEFSNQDNFQLLEDYSIILFKSCFPASDITSDSMLSDYKKWYRQLYKIYQKYPEKLFVPMSTPPLLQANTSPEAARRALAFEEWLLGEYREEHDNSNLAPFGLHSLLSDSNGFLATQFTESSGDDHPNSYSGKVVGQAIVKHLAKYTQ